MVRVAVDDGTATLVSVAIVDIMDGWWDKNQWALRSLANSSDYATTIELTPSLTIPSLYHLIHYHHTLLTYHYHIIIIHYSLYYVAHFLSIYFLQYYWYPSVLCYCMLVHLHHHVHHHISSSGVLYMVSVKQQMVTWTCMVMMLDWREMTPKCLNNPNKPNITTEDASM